MMTEEIDYSEKSLKEIGDAFQTLMEGGDMQLLHKNAEIIKANFYKKLRAEKIAAGLDENTENNPFEEVERGFKELYAKYREMRSAFNAEIEKDRESNLTAREGVIEELKALLEGRDDLKDAFPAFRSLQARWREIGPVAAAKVKEVYDTYQHYVEMFYDYVQINNEFRELDFRKNLEAKTALCEKAEELALSTNPVEAFRTLQKYHEEWKEIGPVSKEYREEIWERFRAASTVVNKMHQAHFERMKLTQEENLRKKESLCERVEAILAEEVNEAGRWSALTREIEDIQKQWREIGFATKKDNQKIYDRFRSACNEFFARKREHYAEVKSRIQDNMSRKISLCEAAEALIDSTEWKETTDRLIALQKEWKETGPVSHKQSEKIWQRFRAACDKFFENRAANAPKPEPGGARRGKSRQGVRKFADKVVSERDNLVQTFRRKEQEIATLENNIGFFAKSKNAESYVADIRAQIESAKNELATLEARIREIEKQAASSDNDGQQ